MTMFRWFQRFCNKTDQTPWVYLAGPINKCTDTECMDWRARAKEQITTTIKDPMDRDFRGKEAGNVEDIVQGDLRDIRVINVLLVNAEKPSWGTAMEIALAYDMGKIVFAFGAGDKPSPWLVYHCDRIFKDLESACTAINRREWIEPIMGS